MDCLNRAYICTGSAVGANIGVDFINITFRNGLNRAFIDTCSASGAIFIDFVSHDFYF